MRNETTSARIAAIAARGAKNPSSLTLKEIRSLCGSVLTQRPAKKRKRKKRRKFGVTTI